MYTTKYSSNKKADLGLFSIHTGDPYNKPRSKNPADDRYRGKQFEVKKTNNAFGYFEYKSEPYTERNSYKDVARKNGFGSSDACKRDEFSNTIAIQQYREAIKAELITAKKAIANGDIPAPELTAPPPAHAETFEYDQVFTVKHDDDIGKSRSVTEMNLGDLRTTTSMYGVGCNKLQKMSKNVRNRSTAQFFNSGHLRVNNDAD